MRTIECIVEWMNKNLGISKESLIKGSDDNMLTSGLVDSFGFLKLINYCEEEMGVCFTETDFASDSIFTLKGIVECIERGNG